MCSRRWYWQEQVGAPAADPAPQMTYHRDARTAGHADRPGTPPPWQPESKWSLMAQGLSAARAGQRVVPRAGVGAPAVLTCPPRSRRCWTTRWWASTLSRRCWPTSAATGRRCSRRCAAPQGQVQRGPADALSPCGVRGTRVPCLDSVLVSALGASVCAGGCVCVFYAPWTCVWWTHQVAAGRESSVRHVAAAAARRLLSSPTTARRQRRRLVTLLSS